MISHALIMKKILIYSCAIIVVLACNSPKSLTSDQQEFHLIDVKTPKETREFFRYSSDRIPMVSAHRGGAAKGYPENCIATFENTLRHTHAILEIDPHYTRDSAIVVMHDYTLERTSSGTGKIIDYTLQELLQLKLKDIEGKLTEYSMPQLGEVLEWAKGKTILVIDAKDVPALERARIITRHKAEANAVLIVYSEEEAKAVFEYNPDILMELMVATPGKVKVWDSSGIPWQNIIAFVTHTEAKDPEVYKQVHARGAMTITGSSRTIDRQVLSGQLRDSAEQFHLYRQLISQGTDIIEADLAIDAGRALQPLFNPGSSKAIYFKFPGGVAQ